MRFRTVSRALPDGSIDCNAILNKIVAFGGLDQSSIGPLMNLAARQSVAQGDVPPGTAQPATPPAPAPLRAMAGARQQSASTSNEPRAMSIAIRGIGDGSFSVEKTFSNLIPRYAAALKVGRIRR